MTKLKTVQWNIGGGKIRDAASESGEQALYCIDGLDYIVSQLAAISPDIITLQEIHGDSKLNQAEYIASKLGLDYLVSDFYADSHVEEGQKLGQAIISRFPISEHSFQFFYNPGYRVERQNGSTMVSHDKGLTTCSIETKGRYIEVKTLHLIPFRPFNIEPQSDSAKKVLEDVEDKLQSTSSSLLVQGDFNLDFSSLAEVLPRTLQEAEELFQDVPTTPKGRKYDHVLYRGIELLDNEVDSSALTDHYPLRMTFNL